MGEEGEQGAGEVLGQVGRQEQVQVQGAEVQVDGQLAETISRNGRPGRPAAISNSCSAAVGHF